MASLGTIQLRVAEADASANAPMRYWTTSLRRVQDMARERHVMNTEERIVCRREQAYAPSCRAGRSTC